MSNPIEPNSIQPHPVHITPMTPEWAAILAPQIARSDPWKQLKIPTRAIESLLGAPKPDHIQKAIIRDGAAIGAMVIHTDWLLGPYLRHLSVIPTSRGAGAGESAIDWLIDYARSAHQRNIWLCVSEFNSRAEAFYRRNGFERAATIDDLVVAGENEILMRRRLIS